MYHEIEGQMSLKTIIFDEDQLIVGKDHYPYSDIEDLAITSAPLFASYGILTLTTGEKKISIPFARSRRHKLESALREYNRMKENESDPYEEMKKLKELLDLEIITREEFDQKKKELLNL